MTVVEDEQIQRIVKGIEQICGSFDEPGNGVFITLPIGFAKGISR